ncbi:50S ribosomal protein L31 [Candidatus Dojkabacteria bacterium]|uniref:50S ribosomal protein L31 n=1 Tax=Candidatus Dojkabacteria bacterium TaxID=2099670 RepID=A0A955I7Q7_9BACT|nr:50S ribosomal protein L31 [Candidatus Dojkabacteria bacterium]
MKAIHPKVNKVVFVDMQTGDRFVSTSTLTSEKTESIDGVDHYVIEMQLTSASHPHYTGKSEQVVDTFDVIKKFKERSAAANSGAIVKKRKKVESRRRSTVDAIEKKQSLTLKDMMKQLGK